jgi:hypothetical protein
MKTITMDYASYLNELRAERAEGAKVLGDALKYETEIFSGLHSHSNTEFQSALHKLARLFNSVRRCIPDSQEGCSDE